MAYTVREGRPIRCGNRVVHVFQVVDEAGLVYCNASSAAEAQDFISVLQAADQRIADAQAAQEQGGNP